MQSTYGGNACFIHSQNEHSDFRQQQQYHLPAPMTITMSKTHKLHTSFLLPADFSFPYISRFFSVSLFPLNLARGYESTPSSFNRVGDKQVLNITRLKCIWQLAEDKADIM